MLPEEGDFGGNRNKKSLVSSEFVISQTMTLLDAKLGADADLWIRSELNEEVIDIAEQARKEETLEERSKRFTEAHSIAEKGLQRLYETNEYSQISEYDDDIKEHLPIQQSANKFFDLEQNLYLEARFTNIEAKNNQDKL